MLSSSSSSSPFPGADKISYQINSYGTDQTLLFSRKTTSQSLVHLLLPNQTAQALHIVPYPSEAIEGSSESNGKSLKEILKQQIFNSWWNGYVLGYPEHMIDSYCHNFHSELSQMEKIQETERAKRITLEYFHSTDSSKGQRQQRKRIQMGSDENLMTEEVTRYLSRVGRGEVV
jgi:hypothetical protein